MNLINHADVLGVVILTASIFFVTVQRAYIAALIALVFASHYLVANIITYLDGFIYYGSAFLFDTVLILILLYAPPPSQLFEDLARILKYICVLNLVGSFMNMADSDIGTSCYVVAMSFLNFLLAARLLRHTRYDRDGIGCESIPVWRRMANSGYL